MAAGTHFFYYLTPGPARFRRNKSHTLSWKPVFRKLGPAKLAVCVRAASEHNMWWILLFLGLVGVEVEAFVGSPSLALGRCPRAISTCGKATNLIIDEHSRHPSSLPMRASPDSNAVYEYPRCSCAAVTCLRSCAVESSGCRCRRSCKSLL